MLVIGNNCCGSMLYRMCKCQFNSPFTWAIVPYDSIINMMSNLYEINWHKIKLQPSYIWENTYEILVDNLIHIHYLHYKFNPKAIKPQAIHIKNSIKDEWNGNIEFCRIWEYVVDKYLDRVNRMCHSGEEPVFFNT